MPAEARVRTPDLGRGLTRFIVTEMIRNATVGRGLALLCADAGLGVRSVTTAAPVFRNFGTADQVFGLRRDVARAVSAGHLGAGVEVWIEDLATTLLFLVVAEVSGAGSNAAHPSPGAPAITVEYGSRPLPGLRPAADRPRAALH
ncbi:hypothetical protein [Nonomuraea sp. LPB2021202275-12-8]|uniref:hypothetical protein n=1 Tax=Nonomuraea sp. LPB2021202275-12-8 TaxID=3120159 RepID=UPI00300C017E